MRHRALILTALACLVAVGCAPSPSEKLVGTWQYDALDHAGQDGEAESSVGLGDLVADVAKFAGVKVGMEMAFNKDQTATMSASFVGTQTSGPMRWEVTKVEGAAMNVRFRPSEGQGEMNLDITWIDDDHLRLVPPAMGDEAVVFTRVRPSGSTGEE